MSGNDSNKGKKSLTSVKALSFDGKHSYWKEWSTKVLAYGRTKGWEVACGSVRCEEASKSLVFPSKASVKTGLTSVA